MGLFDAQRVDVLLLDIRLGTESGLAALTADSTASSGARPEIIVLTATTNRSTPMRRCA